MSSETTPKPIYLHCPNCQKKLKFADPRLFGKKVKCPGCQQPFLVQLPKPTTPAPEEEETVLANPGKTSKASAEQSQDEQTQKLDRLVLESPPVKTPAEQVEPPAAQTADEEVRLELVNDDPPVGTSPRWVPDTPVAASPAFPLPTLQGTESPVPSFATSAGTPAPVIASTDNEPVASTLNRYRRKKSWTPTIIVGLFLLLGVGTIGYLIKNYDTAPARTSVSTTTSQEDFAQPVAENEAYSKQRLEYQPQLVEEFAPTQGEPLKLAMMPRGVTFVIHLRPALLWSNEYQYQELKASLTDDVTNWIAAKLKETCRREPAEIEEAYLGFILGAGGTEPEICSVVHLKEPAKMSALIDEFKGEYVYDITERPDLRLKRDEQYAYLIKDEQTFAICPALYAAELEESLTQPFVLSVPMENLIRETDQQRLFTLVGVNRDLRLHYQNILPQSSHAAAEQILEWVGDDVEAVSWSLHADPYFYSELKLHPVSGSNPPAVQKRIQTQLAELPETLWKELCLKMSPRELRFRNFIGRLPAMLEAFRQSTVSTTTANFASMTTVLPAKAAPNLALAALFTANEAARTDFSADVIVADTNKPKLPDTVVERLRIPVDSEFNRRPLEMALQYLADEIQVNLHVDGDALKDAGYTKNMPQTFNLGLVPVEQSFAQIVNTYQEPGKIMVMSIDEKTKTIHVTTEKFALAKNLPIYKFKSE